MKDILKELKIKAEVVDFTHSDFIDTYYLKLNSNERIDRIEKIATEIALAYKSFGKPIIRPITEKGLISLEFVIKPIDNINFNDIVPNSNHAISLILGKTYAGKDLVVDLTKMPHLLIAGSTGSGKSVMLHSIIMSIVKYNPNVKLCLIDPKAVEFVNYKNIKQLHLPYVFKPEDASSVLDNLVEEMNNRFAKMSKIGANNIEIFNQQSREKMSYIVLVIDEFADLMYSIKKDFQNGISALAQKSRACGIHIIIATQRPSVDVITGAIKVNFPSRISCKIASAADSRVVLDRNGAEKLLGRGDAIINSGDLDMLRFKGAYVSPECIQDTIKENKNTSFFSKVKDFFGRT